MVPTIDILDPFSRIQIGPFISRYSDWILFTLLLFFFWAVAGIALKKRFEESRYLRALITSTALMLAVGTYYSVYRGWLHLNLEGLGMFGAVLLFIVVFFIIFGLMRGFGMRLSNSLSLGFALFYISLWSILPNILHTIGKNFPPVNGILLLLFVVSVFKIITAFLRHSKKSPLDAVRNLQKTTFRTPDTDDVEIEKEEEEEKREVKSLKKKTMKVTKVEINTLDDIEEYLRKMIQLIREKGNTIDQEEITGLSHTLRQIAGKENILEKGLDLIRKHVNAYHKIHRKDIEELSRRLSKAKDKKGYKLIHEELTYQKRMIQALVFLENYESKIINFFKPFNNLLSKAMERLKSHYPIDAQSYLEQAYKSLNGMKHIYEIQKSIEKYLLKVNRKIISDLRKEEKDHQ